MSADGGWTTRRLNGTVEELPALTVDPDADRQVWLMSPADTALVLGSAQSADIVGGLHPGDHGVARRRSGGGAVLVIPQDSVWIDVVINRADPLWEDDVNRAPLWLGQAWREALASLETGGGEVLDRYEPGPWGRLACFASRGPGEVLIDGAKAVGVAQRRTRNTARFQSLVYRRWTPEELMSRLVVPTGQVEDLRNTLAGSAYPVKAPAEKIIATFLNSLPR